jgi:NADH:ubiquinone oxidoreductase subunit K
MQTISLHRFYQVSGIIAAILFALLLVGTATGRNTLAWIYLQSTEAVTNATHFHAFPLDRLDPTCPQCM